jgi:hypothetical protein
MITEIASLASKLANLYGELANKTDDPDEKTEAIKKAKNYQDVADGKPSSVWKKSVNDLQAELDYVSTRINSVSTNGQNNPHQTATNRSFNIGSGSFTGVTNQGDHSTGAYFGPNSRNNTFSHVVQEFKPPHWLVTAGGLLMIIGPFLTWISSTLGGHSILMPFFLEQPGFQLLGGPVALIAGIICVTLTMSPIEVAKKITTLQVISSLVIVIAVVSTIMKWLDLRQQYNSKPSYISVSDAGVLSPGPGLIVVIVGSILVILGASALRGSTH